MENPNSVLITHVVNPHQFYFKYLKDSVNSEFSKFDFEIQLYGNELFNLKTYENGYLPEENELVIFFHLIFNKWIRGRVVSVGEEITLWCIDSGIPERCTSLHVLPLTQRLHEDMNLVHLGGLSLLPTEKMLNVDTLRVDTQLSEQWDAITKSCFKRIVNTSKTFLFTKEFELANHKFGLLTIESMHGDANEINNSLLKLNNVAPSNKYADEDLWSYVGNDRLEKNLYESLTDASRIQMAMVNNNIISKDVIRGTSTICGSQMSSIENLVPNASYDDFDDSVSQRSSHGTMLENETTCGSSNIRRSERQSKVVHCKDATEADSICKSSSIQSKADLSSNVSSSDTAACESFNDFDDSVSAVVSSTKTTENGTLSSSAYRRKAPNLLNDYDHECYLHIRKIDTTRKRQPFQSTIKLINDKRNSASTYNTSESNKSDVSSIATLNENTRKQQPRTASSTKSISSTSAIRNMLATLAKKESTCESTQIVNNSKNVTKYFGVPAGYAKNRLETFGGMQQN